MNISTSFNISLKKTWWTGSIGFIGKHSLSLVPRFVFFQKCGHGSARQFRVDWLKSHFYIVRYNKDLMKWNNPNEST